MRLRKVTLQAAIDGDRDRHDRLERVYHKSLKRHGRRGRAMNKLKGGASEASP